MEQLTLDQWTFLMQFVHPQKIVGLPGMNEAVSMAAFGLDPAAFARIKASFAEHARRAAAELLAAPAFAAKVDRLPFARGAKIVALGDSITDDDQSWAEILRHVLAMRRPSDGIALVNAGVSGDTTAQALARFLSVANENPDWIVCMLGTNDARQHGRNPYKILVSLDETARNLAALKHFAATRTSARWAWITPATVLPGKIAAHWHLGANELMWSNDDLRAVADAVKRMPDPVVDLQALFGLPPNPSWLLDDGLHPSLEGQKAILAALVDRLVS
jgi:lysophospholipase L1-like esterase